MTKSNVRSTTLAILALAAGLATSPALAQDRSVVTFDERFADARSVDRDAQAAVPPNVAGHYTCAFNEPHYRLERKNCGGVHYQD